MGVSSIDKTAGIVTGEAFSYRSLINKLDREISRLIEAEMRLEEENAVDHALNAAFTGFHLLEWQDKQFNPVSSVKSRDLLTKKNNPDLNLLHDIVSKTKHVTISNSPHKAAIDVKVTLTTVCHVEHRDGINIAVPNSKRTFVKFGDDYAYMVLTRVFGLFKEDLP